MLRFERLSVQKIIVFKNIEQRLGEHENAPEGSFFKQIFAPTENFAPRRQNEPGATVA
jgi:hypothetical protein